MKKPGIAEYNALALYLCKKGVSPEEALLWLKGKGYAVKGMSFNGARLASTMQGIYLAWRGARKPRGLQVPPVEQRVIEGEEEVPF